MCRKSLIGAVLVLMAAVLTAEGGSPGSRRGPDSGDTGGVANGTPSPELVSSPASSAGKPWIMAKTVSLEYTIRRTVPEVRFQFSVADERGRLVNSIAADDIRIFDNQRAVQRIRQFSRQDDLPLQVGILLDVSDSVQKNILREKLAAQFFLRQVLRPRSDLAFLVAFAKDVELWQTSTGDPTALRDAVERVQQPSYAATNLYDGVFSACLNQFSIRSGNEAGQRVIVLFSD